MDDHTVLLSDPKVTSICFPSLDPATTAQMEQLMKTFLNPSATMNISLERLAASVKKSKAPPVAPVKNDPPEIFISLRPAILLLVNGPATMAPIAGFEFAVRGECQLAIVPRSVEFHVLLIYRQRLGHVQQPARYLDPDLSIAQADVEGSSE